MKKILSIATGIFQVVTTFVVLLIIYFIFAFSDINEYDFPNGVGFLIFQPLFGLLLCVLTIFACIIAGLPIRLIQRLHNWWSKRPSIPFAGVVIGFILLFTSLLFTKAITITLDGEQRIKQIPNIALALTGWFSTGFSLLHFYPLTLLNRSKTKLFSKRYLKPLEP